MIIKKKALLLCILTFLAPSLAMAATLNVVSSPSAIAEQPFEVNVALDTQGDNVNAVQGELTFPSNLFTFEGIDDAASPISLWIESPREILPGKISFSGIVPGGFIGYASSVIGVVLTPATSSGIGVIALEHAQLLRNDGAGSAMAFTSLNQTIRIAATSTMASGTPTEFGIPFTVPQEFVPAIIKDPGIYGGRYSIVFVTTDKGSGINHYDVAEVPAGAMPQDASWTAAMSPYLLQDQTLSSDIYVRAVNNVGGVTIAMVQARFPHRSALAIALWILAVMLLVLIVFVAIHVRRRQR
jgi:hypothetical protein